MKLKMRQVIGDEDDENEDDVASVDEVWDAVEDTVSDAKYPNVKVRLTGSDGNAMAIIAACRNAARRGKVPQAEIDKFCKEAMSGNYDNVLMTCCKWFDIE